MLQQTQVATVIPYWERWMREVPGVSRLAALPLAEGLRLWQGLGYYRRLRHAIAAAGVIESQHGGVFPTEPAAIAALPGVGRYTAGAILSIAFNHPAPVVDGNVARVLARCLGIDQPLTQREVIDRLWSVAADLVNAAASLQALAGRRCSEVNQALMELGALVCTPRSPACPQCPLASCCRAYRHNLTDSIPRPKPRPNLVRQTSVALAAFHRGRVWLEQRPDQGVNAGFWQLPGQELRFSTRGREHRQAALSLAQRFGIESLEDLGRLDHTIMNRRITLRGFRGEAGLRIAPQSNPKGGWFAPSVWSRMPIQTSHLELLARARKKGARARKFQVTESV